MRITKRSLRRFHKERMKARASRAMPYYEHAYKLADHMASCSGNIYGNRRRDGYNKHKETKKEYLHEVKMYEEIDFLSINIKIKNRKKINKNYTKYS